MVLDLHPRSALATLPDQSGTTTVEWHDGCGGPHPLRHGRIGLPDTYIPLFLLRQFKRQSAKGSNDSGGHWCSSHLRQDLFSTVLH